jgi:ketosteroid isomerase-like protein
MKKLILAVCFVSLLGGVAFADDKDDITALINEYSRLQGTGDIMGQMKMMTEDRIFINAGRRQMDQTANMKGQQASQDRDKKRDPGRQVIVTAVDPIIRIYGNTAVASFYWHWNTIYSAQFLDKLTGPAPSSWTSLIVTQVLVKEGGAWKMVHSHLSPTNAN